MDHRERAFLALAGFVRCGGNPDARTTIATARRLLLIAPAGNGLLASEGVQRRLKSLAADIGRTPGIDAEPKPAVAEDA